MANHFHKTQVFTRKARAYEKSLGISEEKLLRWKTPTQQFIVANHTKLSGWHYFYSRAESSVSLLDPA